MLRIEFPPFIETDSEQRKTASAPICSGVANSELFGRLLFGEQLGFCLLHSNTLALGIRLDLLLRLGYCNAIQDVQCKRSVRA
jgi:hypothetical protein